MLSTMLVANRGEIAVRAFRAAAELCVSTVAVFPHEDRHCIHRARADRSYEIGERGHPVRAYLSVGEIIRVARLSGADAVYPGYGFLSESPALAAACRAAGVTFIGPPAEVLELAGDKARSVAAAREAGVPVLRSTPATADAQVLIDAAGDIGFPLFVKAVAGGGGRGMRYVADPAELSGAIAAASREAAAAFGDGDVFLERAVARPRHIEVQILADHAGDVIHLYERDCSLQRRHQKVVELAPAPNLDPVVRDAILADAVAFARHVGYQGAGTVEFLLDESGDHVFIEMNPRIQVEHTVTEEITDVDLVVAQIRIAAGETLAEIGLSQDTIRVRGAAMQCRITGENPSRDFLPDTGTITAYRAPGGAGVRLDGGTYVGAEIGAHFDSMLVKLTTRGVDHATAARRARRSLAEFRIRGVATNIPFLRAVVADPDFIAGDVTTAFIADHPDLLGGTVTDDRATGLLTYLSERTVNRPDGSGEPIPDPVDALPPPCGAVAERAWSAAAGTPRWRAVLRTDGPAGLARALRAHEGLAVTDTTFRDAHQSLLATRVRTRDLVAVGAHVGALMPGLLSVEAWGGATYDVALRFLHEDPWERLAALRTAMPDTCLQMLLRGRNTVGYTPYPTSVTRAFVAEAATGGIDIFRIFDALNDVDQMRPAIDAVLEQGEAVAEVALCYTGDVSDPAEDLYTLDHWLRLAERIVDTGAHVLAVKDMAGLLRPVAAETLVGSLVREFDLPVHVHTHDTAGGQLATYLAAARAGASAVDAAAAPLAGGTSQPALSALVAATAHTSYGTGLDLEAVAALEPYWERVRRTYAPAGGVDAAPTGRVYRHEIPGGQLSNLRAQAVALGLADRFDRIEDAYAGANELLGRPVKVTPSSKVVGDLALALVGAGAEASELAVDPHCIDLPASVVGFLRGELGIPAGGWPEPFRTRALAVVGADGGPAETPLDAADAAALDTPGEARRETLSRLLFPGPEADFRTHRARYGDVSVLPTELFLRGLRAGPEYRVETAPGVAMHVAVESVSDADADGMRSVMCRVNGALRPVRVRDESVDVVRAEAEVADPGDPGQVGAPFAGVVSVSVAPGDTVVSGDVVAVIEAMKMEAPVTAPRGGTITRVAVSSPAHVGAGELLLVLA